MALPDPTRPKRWIATFAQTLANRLHIGIDGRHDDAGWLRLKIGQLGLLVMDDEDEIILWLLDSRERTNGPIWKGELTREGIDKALECAVSAIESTPKDSVLAGNPPGARDSGMERFINDQWLSIRRFVDSASSGDEVNHYIDEVIALDATGRISDFEQPFKSVANGILLERLAKKSP